MNTTRRQFLSAAIGSSAVVSLAKFVPGFWMQAAAQQADADGERVLVIVQLSGGNDGLNTVVPYGDDAYYQNRFTLAIGRGQVHAIDKYVGFHPAMDGFAELMKEGHMAVVQGVGYPNPNRSHFESMDLWHTAHRKSTTRETGWLGRYLDAAAKGDGRDVPAIHLGQEKQPLALAAEDVRVPSIQSIEKFRLEGVDGRLARTIDKAAAAARAESDELLSFVHRSTASALATSARVKQALGDYRAKFEYPDTPLAGKLRTIAQLIDAGMSTRVYYVTLDGFDTHSNQADAHAGLLRELSGAVHAFLRDLSGHGHAERVVLMAFSEFGRRVKQNASQGTDHGAAAPMFLAGGKLRQAGSIGKHPSLSDLDDGDLKFHTDYRRVYAALLENWLGWKSDAILGQAFEPLPIV